MSVGEGLPWHMGTPQTWMGTQTLGHQKEKPALRLLQPIHPLVASPPFLSGRLGL